MISDWCVANLPAAGRRLGQVGFFCFFFHPKKDKHIKNLVHLAD
jgi:hypothetical protein